MHFTLYYMFADLANMELHNYKVAQRFCGAVLKHLTSLYVTLYKITHMQRQQTLYYTL